MKYPVSWQVSLLCSDIIYIFILRYGTHAHIICEIHPFLFFLPKKDTWGAILEMISAGPSGKEGISSILLSAPEFDENFSLWAGPVFAILEANVSAASAEPLVGVVCFHPKYKTPNGESWPGFGHMHSLPRLRKWLNEANEDLSMSLDDEEVAAGGAYQRRTPHATINVLRAEQLEAAEGRRSTASFYANNIGVLHNYGYDRLETGFSNDKL